MAESLEATTPAVPREGVASPRDRLLPLVGWMAVVVVAAFGPWLDGAWFWDDRGFIAEEARFREPGGLLRLMTEPFGPDGGGVYRPLTVLTFWLQIRLHDLWMPGFRAVNLALLVLTGVWFSRLLAAVGVPAWAARSAALLLVVHPSGTEAVMFVAARHDLLGGMLLIGAALATVRGAPAPIVGAIVFLAVASKEVFVMAPPLLAAWVVVVPSAEALRSRLRRAASVGAASVFGAIAYVALRAAVGVRSDTALDGATLVELTTWVGTVVAHTTHHVFTATQAATTLSFRALPLGSAVLVLAACVGIAAVPLRAALRGSLPAALVVLGAMWLVALAAPTAMAIPSTGQFGNRYLYPSLPGWACLVAASLVRVSEGGARASRLAAIASGVGVLAFGISTSLHASTWRDARTLFEADVESHPDDARVLYHWAVAVEKEEGCAAALPVFQRAAELDPRYGRALRNTAGCLLRLGRPREAIAPAEAALRLDPEHPAMQLNFGTALVLAGRADEGRPWLQRGCARLPRDPACRLLAAPPPGGAR